jgi:hypothetical protein
MQQVSSLSILVFRPKSAYTHEKGGGEREREDVFFLSFFFLFLFFFFFFFENERGCFLLID